MRRDGCICRAVPGAGDRLDGLRRLLASAVRSDEETCLLIAGLPLSPVVPGLLLFVVLGSVPRSASSDKPIPPTATREEPPSYAPDV